MLTGTTVAVAGRVTTRRFKTSPPRRKPSRRLLARLAGAITAFALGTGLAGSALSAPTPVFSAAPPSPDPSPAVASNAVTKAGDYTYGIPISVPPGRLDASPKLALVYASSGAVYGSSIGQGWSLAGVPAIRVDTHATPLGRDPEYVSELAGGALLVKVDDYLGADAVAAYRAEHDPTFARYELLRETARYQWRVRTQDGSELYFGDREATGISHAVRGAVHLVAPLALYRDSFGNVVEYEHRWSLMPTLTWETSTATRPAPPAVFFEISRILYGRNDAAGLGHHALVRFQYEATIPRHCDHHGATIGSRVSYRTGTLLAEGVNTLTGIQTWSLRDGTRATSGRPGDVPPDFDLVREYALEHDEAAARCDQYHAPRRMLSAVRETGYSPTGAAVTRPATRFYYGAIDPTRRLTKSDVVSTRALEGQYGPDAHLNVYAQELATRPAPLVHSKLVDMNGDGRQDWLEIAPQPIEDGLPCMASWWENTGSGFTFRETFYLPSMRWKNGARDAQTEYCSLEGQVSNYQPRIDRGDSDACDEESFASHYYPSHLSYGWEDVDGDGATDLVMAYYRNPAKITPTDRPFATFTPPPFGFWQTRSTTSAAWAGVIDLAFAEDDDDCGLRPERYRNGYLWHVFHNDGRGHLAAQPEVRVQPLPYRVPASASTFPGLDTEKLRQVGFVDYNGDGYNDAAFHYGDGPSAKTYQLQVMLGDADGFFHGVGGSSPLPAADFATSETEEFVFWCYTCLASDGTTVVASGCSTSCPPCPGYCDARTWPMPMPPGVMGASSGWSSFYSSFASAGTDVHFDELGLSSWFDTARVDLNGDGLLDWLDQDGNLRLHTGAGIEAPVDWADLVAGSRDSFPNAVSDGSWTKLLGWRRNFVEEYDDRDDAEYLVHGRSYDQMAWTDWDGDGLLDKVYITYRSEPEEIGLPGLGLPGVDLGDLLPGIELEPLWQAPNAAPTAYVALNMGGLGFLAPKPVWGKERLFAIAGVVDHVGTDPHSAFGFYQWREKAGVVRAS